MSHLVLASADQFKWLAGQLQACRAVILESQKISQSLFGNKIQNLARVSGGDGLCSGVNVGMLGFPISTLSQDRWQTQFQYRSPTVKGLAQYPDGALYISPMKPNSKLFCADLSVLDKAFPITSVMFMLDLTDRAHPKWFADVHQNVLPPRPKQVRKHAQIL